MCTATRGCANLKLVPMLFAPYLGTNINTTFQNSKILFFHRTLLPRVFFQMYRGVSRGGRGAKAAAFFCSLLDFRRKSGDLRTWCPLFFALHWIFGEITDVMTFKGPVLLLRSENISSPAGVVLNCVPFPFKFLGTPLLRNAHAGSQLTLVTPQIKIHWNHTAPIFSTNLHNLYCKKAS